MGIKDKEIADNTAKETMGIPGMAIIILNVGN